MFFRISFQNRFWMILILQKNEKKITQTPVHAYIPMVHTPSIRWPPSSPSSERISHPLLRLGHPRLSGATEVEGIICATRRSSVPFHMDVYPLCLHCKLPGHQPAPVRSHKVVSAEYTALVPRISVGFISRGSALGRPSGPR